MLGEDLHYLMWKKIFMIVKRIDMFLKPTPKLYYNGLHILKIKHHNYLY
jgi:hypothetical protein